MPDIDITAQEGYGDAVTRFNQAKLEAEGDPLKVAEANAAWQTDLAKLTTAAYTRRDAERETELARTQALAEFPDVDPELYNDVSDPTAIKSKAAKLQEAINKHKAPQQGGEGAASWGGTPPSGSVGAPSTAPPKSREERLAELEPEIRHGIKALDANREFKDLTLDALIDTLTHKPATPAQT